MNSQAMPNECDKLTSTLTAGRAASSSGPHSCGAALASVTQRRSSDDSVRAAPSDPDTRYCWFASFCWVTWGQIKQYDSCFWTYLM